MKSLPVSQKKKSKRDLLRDEIAKSQQRYRHTPARGADGAAGRRNK